MMNKMTALLHWTGAAGTYNDTPTDSVLNATNQDVEECPARHDDATTTAKRRQFRTPHCTHNVCLHAVVQLVPQDFRRHVPDRAAPRAQEHGLVTDRGQAEVGDLQVELIVQQNIFGLQVAVAHALRVAVVQSCEQEGENTHPQAQTNRQRSNSTPKHALAGFHPRPTRIASQRRPTQQPDGCTSTQGPQERHTAAEKSNTGSHNVGGTREVGGREGVQSITADSYQPAISW